MEGDRSISFDFSETQNVENVIGSDSFSLKHGEEKEYKNAFPAGSHFSVAELMTDAAADFEISIEGEYTDDNNVVHEITSDSSGNAFVNGSDIQIKGDTVITFTNSRKAKDVRIYKVDDSATPVALGNVQFTLKGDPILTGADGYTPVVTLPASTEAYHLIETNPKAHYNGLGGTVYVTVDASGVNVAPQNPADADKVSVSGPDSNGVYTITVVNSRERYDVTVVKNVEGVETDQDIGFDFTASGVTAQADPFTLYGTAKAGQGTEPEHLHEKTYQNIPYGTKISMTETTENADFATSIHIKNGEAESDVSGRATGDITVDGDVTVTYTNARNRIPIKVVKTDQEGKALAGATFTGDLIPGGSVTTAVTGEGTAAEAVILQDDAVPMGTYTISETKAPSGYNQLEGDVTITIDNNGTGGDINVNASVENDTKASVSVARADIDHPEQGYIVTVKNDAGVELPQSGGIGTVWMYLLGSLLLLGGGTLLAARRRTRA